MDIKTDNTYPAPDLPTDNNNKHNGNGDNEDKNEDGSGNAVDDPTGGAYVNLAKTMCKYSRPLLSTTYLLAFTVCKVYPDDITPEIEQLEFLNLIWQFIYKQQHSNDVSNPSTPDLPMFYGKISIYSSAIATFHVPSDISGIGGMCHEHIHAVKSWRKGPGRYDMIFVNTDSSMEGMQGLDIACVRLFFRFIMKVLITPVR
jgi:hypothetical protein